MEEYVIRLHIPVHDVVFVEYLEGLEELPENEEGLLLGKLALLGEEIFQCASITKLVNEVEVVACLEHVIVFDDVGMRLDIG